MKLRRLRFQQNTLSVTDESSLTVPMLREMSPVLKGELKELWKLLSEEQKHPQLSMKTKKSFRNLWLYELQELLPKKGVKGLRRARERILRIVLLSIPPPTPVIGLDQL